MKKIIFLLGLISMIVSSNLNSQVLGGYKIKTTGVGGIKVLTVDSIVIYSGLTLGNQLTLGLISDSIVTTAGGLIKKIAIADFGLAKRINLNNTSIIVPALTGVNSNNSASPTTVTVTGAVVGNTVNMNPRGILTNVSVGYCFVSAPNTVSIVFKSDVATLVTTATYNFDICVTQ